MRLTAYRKASRITLLSLGCIYHPFPQPLQHVRLQHVLLHSQVNPFLTHCSCFIGVDFSFPKRLCSIRSEMRAFVFFLLPQTELRSPVQGAPSPVTLASGRRCCHLPASRARNPPPRQSPSPHPGQLVPSSQSSGRFQSCCPCSQHLTSVRVPARDNPCAMLMLRNAVQPMPPLTPRLGPRPPRALR